MPTATSATNRGPIIDTGKDSDQIVTTPFEGSLSINRTGLTQTVFEFQNATAPDKLKPQLDGRPVLFTSDEKGQIIVDGNPVEQHIMSDWHPTPEHKG